MDFTTTTEAHTMRVGSLHNLLADQDDRQHDFAVGDGATIIQWTDRTACTVVGVHVSASGKTRTITLQPDTAVRTDGNGMSDAQSYDYSPNPQAPTYTAKLTRRGWRIGGVNGQAVVPGRRHYHDFSF